MYIYQGLEPLIASASQFYVNLLWLWGILVGAFSEHLDGPSFQALETPLRGSGAL